MLPVKYITNCKRGNKLIFPSENDNHLGNVLAIITDAWYIDTCIEEVGIRYAAHITQATDYSAFGAPLPGRTWYSTTSYRYGINTQEKDNDVFVGAYTAEFWEYDSRTGRRWNRDLLLSSDQSVYATFEGNPIINTDPDGDIPGPSFRNRLGRALNGFENLFRKRKLVYVDHDKPKVSGYNPSMLKMALFSVKHAFDPDSRLTIPWGNYQVSDWQTLSPTTVGGWDYYKLPNVSSKLWDIKVTGDKGSNVNMGYIDLKGLDNPGKKWKRVLFAVPSIPHGTDPTSSLVAPFEFKHGLTGVIQSFLENYMQFGPFADSKKFGDRSILASTLHSALELVPAPHRFRNMTNFKMKSGFLEQPSSLNLQVKTKDWNVINPVTRSRLFKWYHGVPQ